MKKVVKIGGLTHSQVPKNSAPFFGKVQGGFFGDFVDQPVLDGIFPKNPRPTPKKRSKTGVFGGGSKIGPEKGGIFRVQVQISGKKTGFFPFGKKKAAKGP